MLALRQNLPSRFTEADLRLYPTVVRFDAAYATLFKCCRRRIADYPNLSAWLRDVYQLDVGAASPVQASTSPRLVTMMQRYHRWCFSAQERISLIYSDPTCLSSCVSCVWMMI